MSTQFSMLELMNAALITQGFDEMLSEEDGSDEWRLLSRNWPTIVEAELEDGLYNFTKIQIELTSRSDGKFGFVDAYIVPLAALHVRRVWAQDDDGVRTDLDWVQDGSKVYVTKDDGIFIEYVETADTSLWSANFARGVQMKLEAVLLRCKEEHQTALSMEQQAEIYFQRARTKASKSRSATEPYRRSRFARARFNRG